jgi:hypothetical protein
MHPSVQYDLMQARQQDLQRSAAQQRVAAQAKAARRPRPDRKADAPRRRLPRLVWRLLPL